MATDTKIISIEIDAGRAIQQITELDAKIEELKAEEAGLKKAIKESGGATEEQRKRMVELKMAITANNNEKRTYVREVQNSIKANRQNEGSLNRLRAELANLTAEYDALSRTEREGAFGKGLQQQIVDLNNELKRGEEETGRFQRSVGAYATEIQSLFRGVVPGAQQAQTAFSQFAAVFVDARTQVVNITKEYRAANAAAVGLGTAQKAAAVGTNLLTTAFKLLRVAIIATGIGALIVALGTLYNYFTRTQGGVEKLNVAMAQVGAVIDVILDRVAMLGKALVQVFSGDLKGAADTAKGALVGIGEELTEETRRAGELRKALNEIEKQEAGLRARRAAEKVEIAELRRLANDTSKSYEERIKAQEEANRIAIKTAEDEKRIGEARIANILAVNKGTKEYKQLMDDLAKGRNIDEIIANQGQAQSTIKDFNGLVDAYERYNQKVQEFTQMTVEGVAKVNSIAKEAATKAKEARDKELAEAEKVIDMQIALIRDGMVRARAEEDVAHRRKVEELKRRLAEEENLTLEARKSINQQLELEEQRHQQAIELLDKEAFDKKLKETQERHQQMLAEKSAEFTAELEQLIADIEAEQAVEFAADVAYFESEKKKHDFEIEADEERKNSQKELWQAFKRSTNALADLAEENKAFAIASKGVALVEIATATGVAMANGIKTASQAKPWYVALAAIATMVSTVLANAARAKKIAKGARFAEGGYVSGEGTATSDSIPAMLSNTESVNNAQSTAMFWPMQSAFNVMGGGAPIIPAQGDVNTAAMRAGEDMLARSVSKGVQSIQVVASWTEGQAVGDRVKMLESLGDVA